MIHKLVRCRWLAMAFLCRVIISKLVTKLIETLYGKSKFPPFPAHVQVYIVAH